MRWVMLFALTALTVGALPALAGSEIPPAAIEQREKLIGEKKVRYLLRQLDLSEQQAAQAQGLIEAVFSGQEAAPPSVDRVREIWAEIEKAKKASDQEKVKALTKQLQQMGREVPQESEFFTKMESHLTDEQKKKLAQAQSRLERNPSGALRPIDLLRAALALDLTPQQRRAVIDAHGAVRKRLGPVLRPSASLRLELVNICVEEVRRLLAPQQRENFEHRARAMRPDLIEEGLRVTLPAEGDSAADE